MIGLSKAWRHRLLGLMLLAPLAGWFWAGLQGRLGVNPAETLLKESGLWTLRFLCLGLAVTPLRTWTGWQGLAPWRRTVGLYTFFYACLHLLGWAWLDQGLDLAALGRDIAKRPFVVVGFTAWLLLVPLAITSIRRVAKAVGGVRWKRLHRLVYVVAVLGVLHLVWLRAAKHRFDAPMAYGAIVAILLVVRRIPTPRRAAGVS